MYCTNPTYYDFWLADIVDIVFKAFLTIEVNVSFCREDLQIPSSLVRKDFSHGGRELQQGEAFFLWGLWEGIVSASLAQANNINEYCGLSFGMHNYRANNSTQ